MIARFTLKAGEAMRRVETMKRFADKLGNETLTHFKDRGVQILREEVPDYTGEMKSKCKGEIKGKTLTIWPDTPYAHIIDGEGTTKSSPGRYVPAIKKRLVNRELSARRQVYQWALKRGYSKKEARVALTTPIKEIPGKEFVAFKSLTPGVSDIKAFGRFTGRDRTIDIARDMDKRRKKKTTRHELVHAVEHKAGGFGRGYDPDRFAEHAAESSGRMQKNIGVHPGAKKTPFSQRTADRLADEAEEWLRQKAREMVS